MSSAADANDPNCHAPPKLAKREGIPHVALVGNPNAGKSTLFNALTGAFAPVGNYSGTTVDRHEADVLLPPIGEVRFVDIPGTWSLAARSPEERIAIDVLIGLSGQAPDVLVVVADAPRVLRSLYLALQVLDLRVPTVLALNLIDEARADGRVPDADALSMALRVPVVPISARSGEGIEWLRAEIARVIEHPESARGNGVHGFSPALLADIDQIVEVLPPRLKAAAHGDHDRARALALWLLLSIEDEEALADEPGVPREKLASVRSVAKAAGRDITAEIVGQRYAWIDARAPGFVARTDSSGPTRSERLDRVLLHPFAGGVVFFAVMSLVFAALFSWSDPLIGLIESLFGVMSDGVRAGFAALGAGETGPLAILRDLIVDGAIGGVGSVVVFVPQIALLFMFLAILEDSGYLARAAHLMDRLLRLAGLPGRAFVPLLSGFACAVPAILATRTMPRMRDRLLTMAVLPLTSCSARLPVYALMIGTVFPATVWGFVPARPLALFTMYLLSAAMTVVASMVIGRVAMPDSATPDLIELPPYRLPQPKVVARLVYMRVREFLGEAGRVILVATLVLWALMYFPRYSTEDLLTADEIASAEAAGIDPAEIAAPRALEKSFAGHIGHAIEPAVAPLGFDWRIGIGLVGAFAAREVFVSTLGVVHGISDAGDDDTSLRETLHQQTRPDGSPMFTPLVGASLMVFFAFAMQCLSTLAVLRRESHGWKWPAFIVTYMSALAWISAFVVYQGGKLLGFH